MGTEEISTVAVPLLIPPYPSPTPSQCSQSPVCTPALTRLHGQPGQTTQDRCAASKQPSHHAALTFPSSFVAALQQTKLHQARYRLLCKSHLKENSLAFQTSCLLTLPCARLQCCSHSSVEMQESWYELGLAWDQPHSCVPGELD